MKSGGSEEVLDLGDLRITRMRITAIRGRKGRMEFIITLKIASDDINCTCGNYTR